ncbi:RICIN domain-containing protein [Streptomyces sp. L2]|uniref:RICIN domain-containing protein n=1 Tax=Streptomyces sp. L2 TaxID=2162665 RepID=UPI0010115442|nr:RICIN domain-containing protein [Streptomyces sp. L2]
MLLRTPRRSAVAICLGLLLPLLAGAHAKATPVAITNGTQFTDTAGKVVRGHDGGVIKVGPYYYWFGENPYSNNRFHYISVYRSTDLRAWQFRNNVLSQASAPQVENLQRPKVIYNARTHQYVLFMRKENHPAPLTEDQIAIATSATVDGRYTYRGSFRPLGYRSFDMSVFRDTDGTAYVISTTNHQKDLTVFRMTADYLRVAARVTTLHNVNREAATLFKRNGVYFLLTSGVTGWQPNQTTYTTATHIAGPWRPMANLGDSITYGSQPSFVLPIQGRTTTSYLYMGDRHGNAWGGGIKDGEYVWLPLRFGPDRTLSMPWYPRVSINTSTGVAYGVGSGYAYDELVARHSGQCLTARWSMADGAGVTQRACGTAANPTQHWQVLRLGNGSYRLVARYNHKCLTVPSSSTANGQRVTQRTCGTGTDQQWRFTKFPNGYRITAGHSGRCLTIVYNPAVPGPQAVQYTCKGTANQRWQLARAPY